MIKLNLLRKFWDRTFLSFTEKSSAIIYFVFIVRLHFKEGIQRQFFDFQNIIIILTGLLSIILLARMLSLLTRKISWLHIASNFIFMIFYLGIGFYHLRSRTPLDYSIIADNIGLLFYKQSGGVIFDIFRDKDKIQVGFISLVLVGLQWRYGLLGRFVEYGKKKIHVFIVSVGYLVLFIVTPYFYEEYSSFLKTMTDYYSAGGESIQVPEVKYPYKKFIKNSKVAKQPHVFIITVESFNANAVRKRARNGKEYTPFYNELTKKGLYFQNFYGHSIQTAKGHLAIYCSLLPLTKKKVFVSYPDVGIKCLPHVLKESGYSTYFFKAFANINFDNTYYFAKRMGFDHIYGMNSKFVSAKERKMHSWGWGVQDDLFYKKFFEYLDNNRGEKIFAALTTVSNHMKFKRVPEDLRYIYPHSNRAYQRYANSIRISDEYLKTFFIELEKRDYLKDSIVIVTGDHSYPWGEHLSYASQDGYYDENFKTPLVIVGTGINAKDYLTRYSQVDIAPTIMDLVGASSEVPFRGKSFFKAGRDPIHLIQPYDGGYLAVVVGKYKYVYHRRTKREFCYDLDSDPIEDNNIIDEMEESPSYRVFKKGIDDIVINDYLIINDRIWKR